MMTETVVNVQDVPNNNAGLNKPQGGNEQALSWIKINVDYFKTTPGLLKIVEFVFGIVCMATASPAYSGGTHFFLFVVTVCFIGTFIWIFIYLLGIREAINFSLNWILTELANTAICTVAYFIAFIIQLVLATSLHPIIPWKGSYIAAGVFGLFNTLVFAFATYLLYAEWRGSRTNHP